MPPQHTGEPLESGELMSNEVFWKDHQPWLETCGYKLRNRYSPDWVASWNGIDKFFWECEDGHPTSEYDIMDAARIKDGAFVSLKKIRPSKHPMETEIIAMFAAEPVGSDPQNHCVPLYEVLKVPGEEDMIILVMPFLSHWEDPCFATVGEIVDFFGQIIEGLQFMHRQNVAHRDCKSDNIMLDSSPLYPEPRHPVNEIMKRDWSGKAKPLTRIRRPVKYYFIDFGLSKHYPPSHPHTLEPPTWAGDKTVPEFKIGALVDPFPVDVYCLGNFIREMFTESSIMSPGMRRLGFMKPLVSDMVQDDPQKRPTMDEVAARFFQVRQQLRWWTLHARAVKKNEGFLSDFIFSAIHWTKHTFDVVVRR
ncbi:kinase-like domain-containing protein [Mycena sp. CBHHK59/15]|nr:kinase-like domain-containing protein [Mycena sp. CBHHK59/15]